MGPEQWGGAAAEVIAALTEAGQALDDADFQAASDRVSAWFAANCGS